MFPPSVPNPSGLPGSRLGISCPEVGARSPMNGRERDSRPRVTLRDIASDASVSRATVSLVLRDVPVVAKKTREKVLRSMSRLGYVYHRGAASLRTQKTNAIGLIVTDITNPFFAEIIVAIENKLGNAGYVILLGNTSETVGKQQRLLATMQEYPADGVLLCPATDRSADFICADSKQPHSDRSFRSQPCWSGV